MKLEDHEIRALIAHHADILSDCVMMDEMDRESIFGAIGRIMELAEMLPQQEESIAMQ